MQLFHNHLHDRNRLRCTCHSLHHYTQSIIQLVHTRRTTLTGTLEQLGNDKDYDTSALEWLLGIRTKVLNHSTVMPHDPCFRSDRIVCTLSSYDHCRGPTRRCAAVHANIAILSGVISAGVLGGATGRTKSRAHARAQHTHIHIANARMRS